MKLNGAHKKKQKGNYISIRTFNVAGSSSIGIKAIHDGGTCVSEAGGAPVDQTDSPGLPRSEAKSQVVLF